MALTRTLSIALLALVDPAVGCCASVDCKTQSATPYSAELSGSGDGRSVQVCFKRRPPIAEANKLVTACMQKVLEKDSTHEMLGTAWVGETQISLAPGKQDLAYFPKEGRIRPFGLDEAVKNLKRK